MKSESYNIVLLPPTELFKKTIDLSKLLSSKFKTEFVVKDKKTYPHATLYQVEIPVKNRDIFFKVLKEIFKNKKKIKTTTTGYATTETFISINLKKTKSLVALHQQIIKEINPLRDRLVVSKISKDWKVIPKEYGNDLKSYGSLGVLTGFRPHFTITRLKSPKNAKEAVTSLPRLVKQSFSFGQAALGKLGSHGTVVKIFSVYNLK